MRFWCAFFGFVAGMNFSLVGLDLAMGIYNDLTRGNLFAGCLCLACMTHAIFTKGDKK